MWSTKNLQVSFRVCHENFRRAPLPPSYWENPGIGLSTHLSQFPTYYISCGEIFIRTVMSLSYFSIIFPQCRKMILTVLLKASCRYLNARFSNHAYLAVRKCISQRCVNQLGYIMTASLDGKGHYLLIILRLGSNWRTLLVQQCRRTKVEPFDISSQQCRNVSDQHDDHTKFVFGFCQTFQPTNVFMMTFTETGLSQTSNSSHSWTQEAVHMAATAVGLICQWIQVHGTSGMSKK